MPSIENFVSAMNLGYFDAELNTKKKKLDIVVNIYLRNSIATNSVVKNGKNKLQIFKEKLHVIKDFWEGKYSFQQGSTKVVPKFHVNVVDNVDDAHFVVHIYDATNTERLQDYFYTQANAGFQAPCVSVMLANKINFQETTTLGGKNEMVKKPRYAAFPWNSGYTTGKDSYSLDDVINDLLKGYRIPYSNAANSCFLDWTELLIQQSKIVVKKGAYLHFYLDENIEVAAKSKINRLLTKVPGIPRFRIKFWRFKANAPEVFLRIQNNATKKENPREQESVDAIKGALDGKQSFNLNIRDYRQKCFFVKWFTDRPTYEEELYHRRVLNHEFGHILGLPDDYFALHTTNENLLSDFAGIDNTNEDLLKDCIQNHYGLGNKLDDTNDIKIATQKNYLTLCKTAQIAPPRLGRNTSSVMSYGSCVEKCHMITLWECLKAMTHTNWKII